MSFTKTRRLHSLSKQPLSGKIMAMTGHASNFFSITKLITYLFYYDFRSCSKVFNTISEIYIVNLVKNLLVQFLNSRAKKFVAIFFFSDA